MHCTFSILGQQLSFKRKHRGVAPIHGPWSRISKTSHLKLKREVSRTEKKVQDCDYVFGSSTTFQRRKEWICESRCCQVSVRLHVFVGFFALKPFHDYSLCSVCILPQPAFYSQSAVCILHTVCILPLVRSLQSAVRSLRFTLTDYKNKELHLCSGLSKMLQILNLSIASEKIVIPPSCFQNFLPSPLFPSKNFN